MVLVISFVRILKDTKEMTELLTVPLKRGSDIDLGGPLTRWIQVVNYIYEVLIFILSVIL